MTKGNIDPYFKQEYLKKTGRLDIPEEKAMQIFMDLHDRRAFRKLVYGNNLKAIGDLVAYAIKLRFHDGLTPTELLFDLQSTGKLEATL